MKTINLRIKPIAFFLIVMMMLQSCMAYQKAPVNLLKAEQSRAKVKLKTDSNQIHYFKQVILEEDQFYGLKMEKGEMVKIEIHEDGANRVFLHNKSKSIWNTVAVIAIPVAVLVTILAATVDLGPSANLFQE